MKRLSFVIAFSLIALSSALGQNKLSPMLRQTIMESSVHSPVNDSTLATVKTSRADKTYISAFICFKDASAIEDAERLGAIIRTRTNRFATTFLPVDALDELSSIESIEYIEMGSPTMQKMDEAKKASNVNAMLEGTNLPQGLTGKDVIVGIIDNGFDYGHPNFYDKEKNALRIKKVWNQNIDGTAPEGYNYGSELTTEDEILASETDDKTSGHGTHVAGIATGADDTNGHDYAGIAQDAEIVLVALDGSGLINGDNTAVLDGINYIFDYAEEQGKPAVINMSLGSFIGPRDGTSSFDQMCDELLGPGRIIVGAFGNDGSSTCHTSMDFTGDSGETLKALYDFKFSNPSASYTEIWGEEGMELTITPIALQKSTGQLATSLEPLTVGPDNEGTEVEYKINGLDGSIKVASEVNPLNGKPHFNIVVYFNSVESYYIGFHLTSQSAGTAHVWTDNVYSCIGNHDIDGYVSGDDRFTAGELGGTGNRIISVGGYVTRDYYEEYSMQRPSGETLNDLASFSSHGPTVDGRTKPDICAPSSYIISSISTYDLTSPRVRKRILWNDKSYYFGYMQGTSMASPFVTGVMASWLQAWPEMTPEDAKEIMQATAINDDFTGDIRQTGDADWGYGKIDAYEGVKVCLQKASGLSESTMNDVTPAVICNDGNNVVLLFTSDMTDVTVRLTGVDGKTIYTAHDKQVNAGEEIDLLAEQCYPGIYIISIDSEEGARQTEKIIIN